MKAVLLSIQPKWCELIASGEKTVEVRKTKPKLETPFKVYIYCTKGRGDCLWRWNGIWYDTQDPNHRPNRLDGKVIGEFVCEWVHKFKIFEDGAVQDWNFADLEKSCLTYDEIAEYVGGGKYGYAWRISDLVIYDKPKKLSEFSRPCDGNCQECEHALWQTYTFISESKIIGCMQKVKAPQSWCYVEERSATE